MAKLNEYEKDVMKYWGKIHNTFKERDRAIEWATNHRKLMSVIMKLDEQGQLEKALEGYM